jgi:hypothetical protein
VAGLIFTVAGPLRPGWNALANGASSGNSLSQAIVPSTSQRVPSTSQGGNTGNPFATPFTASLQGTMTQNGPDANGTETLRVNATLGNGTQGVLAIVLKGTQENLGGEGSGLSITSTQVMLGRDATIPLYQGHLTGLRNREYSWRMTALLAKTGITASQVEVQIDMQIVDSGQVTGVIQGVPVQGSPSAPATQQV